MGRECRSRRGGQDTYLTSLVFSGERDEFMLPAVNLPALVAQLRLIKDDDEILDLAAEAGCWYVYQAIFDTSDYIRKRVKRLQERGIGVETMNTAAACRTYNVLASEGRAVLAALLLEPAAGPVT